MLISGNLAILIISASIIGLTIACVSFIVATLSLCRIIGLEKSTHQIQYVPVDEEIEKANEEWRATESTTFEEQEKLYKQQLEDELPEFALNDEDKKTFSF
jgi:hypothetical protein